ncbi:DUF2089 family protein [soil metagenome]
MLRFSILESRTKNLTSRCPFCDGELEIIQLRCGGCETRIDSALGVPTFFRLPSDLQEFVLVFLRCRGNIREVEKALGISYPTVCKRLDLVNGLLDNGAAQGLPVDRNAILKQVEAGELTAKEAAKLLREHREHRERS